MVQGMRTDLANFFERFSAFLRQRQDEHFQQFRFWWEGILPQMTSLLEKAAEEEKKSAPRHNLFRLLNLRLDEPNTHSRLLADLLSPRGTHGQQHLFLAEFLRRCQGPHGIPAFQESALDDWRVEREKAIPN